MGGRIDESQPKNPEVISPAFETFSTLGRVAIHLEHEQRRIQETLGKAPFHAPFDTEVLVSPQNQETLLKFERWDESEGRYTQHGASLEAIKSMQGVRRHRSGVVMFSGTRIEFERWDESRGGLYVYNADDSLRVLWDSTCGISLKHDDILNQHYPLLGE